MKPSRVIVFLGAFLLDIVVAQGRAHAQYYGPAPGPLIAIGASGVLAASTTVLDFTIGLKLAKNGRISSGLSVGSIFLSTLSSLVAVGVFAAEFSNPDEVKWDQGMCALTGVYLAQATSSLLYSLYGAARSQAKGPQAVRIAPQVVGANRSAASGVGLLARW